MTILFRCLHSCDLQKMFENYLMDQVCLVCLQQHQEMMSIFQRPYGSKAFVEIINECIGYKFTHFEGLPQKICENCQQYALDAFKFKQKCIKAFMQLTGNLQINTGFQRNVETQTESTLLYLGQFCDEKDHRLEQNDGKKCENCQKSLSCVEKLHSTEVAERPQMNATEKFPCLPVIEEVDLKILGENSFCQDNSNERDEDLLVYIKQFDGLTDDEDDEPLSKLQQTGKLTGILDEIDVAGETDAVANSNIFNIVTGENKESISNEEIKNKKAETKVRKRKNKAAQIHQCNICEKKFTTSTYLQRHVIMHAMHAKKRLVCKECSLNFSTKEELRDHIKSQGHDKKLLCPECGLRCRTSNILMIHLRRHKGEKPYKCKFCSKGFPRSDDLRLHEKYHTGEKSHFCGTCGKGFQRKYNLKIHLRVHTGEKPYKCPHCPQAFAQGNDLKAHIRRHTGERFRCEVCDAAFLQGYQIRQHKLSEHGIRDEPPTQRVAKFTSIESQKQQILRNMNKEEDL